MKKNYKRKVEDTNYSLFRRKISKNKIVWVNNSGGEELIGKIAIIVRDKGYGFIKSDSISQIFFHKCDLSNYDFDRLKVHMEVEFDIKHTNKGQRAVNVNVTQKSGILFNYL